MEKYLNTCLFVVVVVCRKVAWVPVRALQFEMVTIYP